MPLESGVVRSPQIVPAMLAKKDGCRCQVHVTTAFSMSTWFQARGGKISSQIRRATISQYDFQGDVAGQQTAYADKLNAKFRADIADEVRMARMLRVPAPQAQQTQTRVISHVLGTGGATLPMQSLEPLHYVSCHVDLESLRQGKPLIPEFGELIKWVCAPESSDGRPKIGKLRLNCHGAGEYNQGLLMGKSNLGPEALVDALMRHGLTTRSMQFSSTQQNAVGQTVSWKERSEGGVVKVREATARWKADNEANACENEKCKKQFTFVRRKHHCRPLLSGYKSNNFNWLRSVSCSDASISA
jgi:hypothetical protein